jgi:hypothetical protein
MEDSVWKQHARYGHLNFQALRKLGQKQMVRGIPCVDHVEQLCVVDLLGNKGEPRFQGKDNIEQAKFLS